MSTGLYGLHGVAPAVLSAVLAACTGAPETSVPQPVQQAAAVDGWRVDQAEVRTAPAAVATDAKQPPAAYSLIIFRGNAVYRDRDQLEPTQGSGYPVLRAFVYARGAPRKASPVADVKPVCRTANECEYLPSRKSGFAERYVVSLKGEAPVELRAENDQVVIAARSLGFAQRTTVTVTLSAPGSAPVATRIVYAPPAS